MEMSNHPAVLASLVLGAVLLAPLPAEAAPLTNDDIVSAVVVGAVPFTLEQNTIEATRAKDDPATAGRDCFGNEGHTVWFRFIGSSLARLSTSHDLVGP